MKRAIVLAILGLFVIAAMASADSAFLTLKNGQNLVAASLVPYEPTPSSVFTASTGGVIDLHTKLSRWNANTQGYVVYNKFNSALYGKVLLGDGAWLKNTTGADIMAAYNGVPNGVPDSTGTKTDMWISLPKAGNTLIGLPFYSSDDSEKVLWSNCQMTDGNVTISIAAAKAAPYSWTTGIAKGWNASTQGYYDVRVESYAPNKYLMPNQGYWIKTNVPNLALIIPANP